MGFGKSMPYLQVVTTARWFSGVRHLRLLHLKAKSIALGLGRKW